MKFIAKPIKRGRITESALAAVILSGAIAVTASGCTAEIKLADGTPIGSVVINDEALASGITVNQQGANADVITDPSVVLPKILMMNRSFRLIQKRVISRRQHRQLTRQSRQRQPRLQKRQHPRLLKPRKPMRSIP